MTHLEKINDNIQKLVKKIQDQDKEISAIKTILMDMGVDTKALELHRALEDDPKIKELSEEIPIVGIEKINKFDFGK